jgi:hypothetical protein
MVIGNHLWAQAWKRSLGGSTLIGPINPIILSLIHPGLRDVCGYSAAAAARTMRGAMKRASAAAALLLFIAAPALAAPPGEIAGIIKAEQPYGAGKLRKFFISVYDAALWTDAPKWSMQSPFALSIAYRLSLSKDDLTDSTVKEMGHVNPRLDAAALAAYRGLLTKVYADVNSGDTITALYTPDGVVHFFHNGHATGEVHDRTFAQSFFDIWLSPATSEPSLRAGLLHLGS